MQEQPSQVNFRKLVSDLADMYSDHPFDVVITELVANSLDAKARTIEIEWDDDRSVLVVTDDGDGMDSVTFKEYHDFAAEIKNRGAGIGFAGVGAKISFNIANRVITATRHNGQRSASDWRWYDDNSLRWSSISSNHLSKNGTRVEVHFNDERVPSNITDEYLVNVLKRHYLPLFITEFVRSYSAINLYSSSLQFIVNGLKVDRRDLCTTAGLSQQVIFKTKSGGWGSIGVSEDDFSIESLPYGILLCTHGKVIKAELFNQSTGALGSRLFGVVEIPALVEYVTTNKSELKRGPGRSQRLNRLLNPVRDELRKFLAKHGVAVVEQNRNQLSEKLERELKKMVNRLPELQDFDGLLRRSRALRRSDNGNIDTSDARSQSESATADKPQGNDTSTSLSTERGGSSRKRDKDGRTRAKTQRSRRNQGPRVAFEVHPDRSETAWLDSDTVVINSGHTAYSKRINQDQARLTYCMFAIGVALDKAEIAQSNDGVSYVDKFIAAWGQS